VLPAKVNEDEPVYAAGERMIFKGEKNFRSGYEQEDSREECSAASL
jgi:hypothetical protein